MPSKKQRRYLTPLRLIVVGILMTAVLTAFWLTRQRDRESAEHDLKLHGESGYVALREKNFSAAEREFRLAVGAIDVLDRATDETRDIRQMLKESTAAAHLADDTLIESFTVWEQERERGTHRWQRQFQDRFADKWIVLETSVFRVSASGSDKGRLIIDYPLIVGKTVVKLDGALHVFQDIAISAKPRRVVFAAQLESCRFEEGDVPTWVIRLKPQTAFLWTNYENFRALGFDVAADEEGEGEPGENNGDRRIMELLEKQSKTVE